MNPLKNNEDRDKRRYPFGDADENMFEHIFDKMQRILKNSDFKEMCADLLHSNFDSNKHFISGYVEKTGVDAGPKIQEFGNFPQEKLNNKNIISDSQKSMTDVIEGDEIVTVTIELPDVKKEDLELKVTENVLKIKVDSPQHKYHKVINLPCDVKEKTTKATYKNGILDVIIKRKEKRSKRRRHKVNID